MYSLNEKVVYPGQGVAKINQIIEKSIAGKQALFFELKFLNKDMTILVPVDNILSVGIRKLSSEENINCIFNILCEPQKQVSNIKDNPSSSWNKRSKQYQGTLRGGNITEISKIYRDLKHISQHKPLSFGERNLLVQTENLLAQEISLVRNILPEAAIEKLRSCFEITKFNTTHIDLSL